MLRRRNIGAIAGLAALAALPVTAQAQGVPGVQRAAQKKAAR
jgi:hypothetical protein